MLSYKAWFSPRELKVKHHTISQRKELARSRPPRFLAFPFPTRAKETDPSRNPTPSAMSSSGAAPAAMAVDDAEDDQLATMSTDDILRASRLLDNEIRVLKASATLDRIPCSRPSMVFESSLGVSVWAWTVVFFCDVQDELQRTNLDLESFKEKIKENQEKIKLNKQLPYLVGNIVEVWVTLCSPLFPPVMSDCVPWCI
jgi:hypothetical protein